MFHTMNTDTKVTHAHSTETNNFSFRLDLKHLLLNDSGFRPSRVYRPVIQRPKINPQRFNIGAVFINKSNRYNKKNKNKFYSNHRNNRRQNAGVILGLLFVFFI
ncbi:hypothetical protein NQD34_008906 [Periophthalmus magnuspinnatus]|nr:hypothetical protein NQD34_008906 [Periophthalmus magnuspinnatus]